MSDNQMQVVPHGHGSGGGELTVVELRSRADLVKQVLRDVMQEGHHYGQVPGTKGAPVLLKAGAEKLAMVFRLAPRFDIVTRDLPGAHREYLVTCVMSGPQGNLLGSGVGSCSTMESKYRYRWRGEGRSRTRAENPDIADTYNTVLKMAKKRAQVDATLTVTGASDIFAPDPEDDEDPPARDQSDGERDKLIAECVDLRQAVDDAKFGAAMRSVGIEPGKVIGDRSTDDLRMIRDALRGAK